MSWESKSMNICPSPRFARKPGPRPEAKEPTRRLAFGGWMHSCSQSCQVRMRLARPPLPQPEQLQTAGKIQPVLSSLKAMRSSLIENLLLSAFNRYGAAAGLQFEPTALCLTFTGDVVTETTCTESCLCWNVFLGSVQWICFPAE